MAFKKSNATKATQEPSYEVLEECGTISTNARGWSMKLRYISWNGKDPKYDLRSWKEDESGEKCGKGITLTGEEMETLFTIMQAMAE